MRRASACAPSPALLITQVASISAGAPPPVRTMKRPPRSTSIDSTGACSAHTAPSRSASPSSASISWWLSTMPVDGENSASTHSSAGSSVCASARVSGNRSSTPFSAARAAIAFNCFTCAALVATSSLPVRRCGT